MEFLRVFCPKSGRIQDSREIKHARRIRDLYAQSSMADH